MPAVVLNASGWCGRIRINQYCPGGRECLTMWTPAWLDTETLKDYVHAESLRRSKRLVRFEEPNAVKSKRGTIVKLCPIHVAVLLGSTMDSREMRLRLAPRTSLIANPNRIVSPTPLGFSMLSTTFYSKFVVHPLVNPMVT